MSRQNSRGVWVIPVHQAREFDRPIDYHKLVRNCLADKEVASSVAYGKKMLGDPDDDFELELEDAIGSQEWYKLERAKPVLRRHIKSLFRRVTNE